jgi:hypothetical protein
MMSNPSFRLVNIVLSIGFQDISLAYPYVVQPKLLIVLPVEKYHFARRWLKLPSPGLSKGVCYFLYY